MLSSPFGPADTEVLLWTTSCPTADAAAAAPPMIHADREPSAGGGGASPLASSSLSSSSSPPPFYSPPPSPPAPLLLPPPSKDLLSFPWLSEPLSDGAADFPLGELDWMDERMDVAPFDLDALIGCDASPDDLLAALHCPMEPLPLPLEPLPLPLETLPLAAEPPPGLPLPLPLPPVVAMVTASCDEEREVPTSPLFVPEPQEELEIKSEPASPSPSSPRSHASPSPSFPRGPTSPSPSSPSYTLDLGSEVDVSDSEVKPVAVEAPPPVAPPPVAPPPVAPPPVVPQLPRLVLSLPATRIVLLLAPKKEVSEAVGCSPAPPPPQSPAPRCRPYPHPAVARATVRTAGRTAKDKKHKKMEQNKTAATRYRQKKREESESLAQQLVELERKNLELTERAESTEREILYLKELMEEVRLARLRNHAHDNHAHDT